ncbi:Endonuclease V [Tenacibaculum sp. 190524A02b]|uniref:endonuclease V n=1 Tax=Tenacibaculum vairaonense TaxID=3137860 RepID=UPI0032B16F6E
MILAFDTYYYEDKAKTVGIAFNHWQDEVETTIYEETLSDIAPYVSGEFYKRELPCIMSLLNKIDLTNCQAIIIDGFVVLDDTDKLGLGGYLYEKLHKEIPIIGVAKNNFANLNNLKRAILRGESKKPLYINAKGVDLDIAATNITSMFGKYRIPDLLKKVDSLGRMV